MDSHLGKGHRDVVMVFLAKQPVMELPVLALLDRHSEHGTHRCNKSPQGPHQCASWGTIHAAVRSDRDADR